MSVLLNLSGILPAATKVKNQGKTTQKPAFEIDRSGNIKLDSMHDSVYKNLALKYDTNNDGKLRGEEIGNFLSDSKISDDDVYTGYINRKVYYQETDKNGNVTKRAAYSPKTKETIVATYEDGKPVFYSIHHKDSEVSHEYNFRSQKAQMYSLDSDTTYFESDANSYLLDNYYKSAQTLYDEHQVTPFWERAIDYIKNLF